MVVCSYNPSIESGEEQRQTILGCTLNPVTYVFLKELRRQFGHRHKHTQIGRGYV